MLWSRSLGHNGLSPAGDPGCTSQTGFVAPYQMHDLRVLFSNILNNANTSTMPPNPVTVSATLEYPANIFYPLTFGGNGSVTIAPNGMLKSDNVSITVPAGAAPLVRTDVRVALAPIAPAVTTVSTGGALAAATYYYKVVADCGLQGLSGGSAEFSVATTGGASVNTLSWTADPLSVPAVRYLVYRATASGAQVLLASVPASGGQGVNSFVDTGAIATPAAWTASQAGIVAGTRQTSNGNVYLARVGGAGSTTAPSGTTAFSDGTIRWVYVGSAAPPAAQQYPYNAVVNFQAPPNSPAAGASSSTVVGANGGNFLNTSGKAWNASGTIYTYGPNAILGTPDQGYDVPVVAIFGDSISVGYNQYSSGGIPSDMGYIAAALIGANIPYYSTGRASEANTIGFLVDNRNRLQFAQAASDAIYEYGINDFYVGAASLATGQAAAIQSWLNIKERGPRVWACTLLPLTTSTDNWATVANQTVGSAEANRTGYNTWLRAGAPLTISGNTYTAVAAGTAGAVVAGGTGHPLSGVFDPAILIEVNSAGTLTANGGFWMSNGTAQTYTFDGVHPRDAAVQLLKAGIVTANFIAP